MENDLEAKIQRTFAALSGFLDLVLENTRGNLTDAETLEAMRALIQKGI
jgi:hypothetical protein